MDLGFSILKGVIQGLTEFLPISSTAHLTFINALYNLFGLHATPMRPGEDEFFDILLHLGTLAAVVWYFRRDLTRMWLVWSGKEKPLTVDAHSGLYLRKLPIFIAISMTVTVVFILFMLKGSEIVMQQMGWASPAIENISDYYFAHPYWVALHLMCVGGLLYFTEKTANRPKSGQGFNYVNALVIGLAQGIAAIFHGFSRSGTTISAGLASGVDRVTATRYTFMLSIPTFLMAAVYEAVKLYKMGYILELNWPVMLVGTVFSAIVGYFCVKYLIQYVANHSLVGFAYYCWIVGALMLGLFLFAPAHFAAAG